MGLPQDFSAPASVDDSTSPLSKRRRFTPQSLPPIIPVSDNASIESHTFDSPLLLQLCEQAPSQGEIEAGLLQVGMRVRKSVAEGYKIQPKKFTPRPFFNYNRLSPETQAALSNGNAADEMSPFSPSQVQPMSTATFCGISLSFLSEMEEPVSQQSLWSYSTSHKRGHEVESDSEESQDWQPQTPNLTADAGMSMPIEYFAMDMENMSDFSPMTQLGDRRQHANGRRMAMPKSRRHPEPQMLPTSAFNPFAEMAVQQPEGHFGHKRMMSCGMEAMDFGDAPFLQRREDVEMDCS
ncbi:hypothetical protein LTR10_023556 [Elasticomyces elasticus]|uniref:Uncharacterized protein n=1 Tax=Exophiala sideris TaxID=1016849 RepID=A0ABR0J6J2_9EURO|nr:hypothetical protein LTR10_023556 [Elasticomyces elasticus]KAK5028746.1 hypothetical protein LTS07_006125 [Exophiala sideris]KAK5035614.1 hypothetical protein LTR13_005743 [Exophiala sideris]KAK5057250.1 hypothetical protein LTR69_007289 [Exophiala sideris]KAK5181777.1 hypothetical protein LTR44_005977 [Eurotiomycetes sp. CCFEE 6388]